MTGLQHLRQATEIMLITQGEYATVRLTSLLKLIDLVIEQDKK